MVWFVAVFSLAERTDFEKHRSIQKVPFLFVNLFQINQNAVIYIDYIIVAYHFSR